MKVPTSLAVLIIVLFLMGAVGIGYYQYRQVAVPPEVPVISDSLAFHTEEEWTVLQISQFLADFGTLKSKEGKPKSVVVHKLPSSEEAGHYELKWEGKKETVSLATGVWNPATYKTWAKSLLLPSDPVSPSLSSLACAETLLNPDFKVLAAENERLSKFLSEHPASAAGHLQAALLVGTIALNDYSGMFCDLRIPLNRMTSHLAAADALGMQPGDPARQLAEGLLLTLCGQQADALTSVAAWPEEREMKEWKAILRLRNTWDWREGRSSALAGSPALRREYFRALSHALDVANAMEFFKESGVQPDIAYWRIANERPLSVQQGHLFSKPILGFELEESAKAAKHFGISVSEKNLDWINEYLDTPEGSPVVEDGKTIQVAGRNLFAGYHQRHLMQGGQKLYGFLNDKWGVPDKSKELENFIEDKLPNLRYKPFLLRMIAREDDARRKANVSCEAIIHKTPEMVTPELWASLRKNEDDEEVLSSPDFHAWFHPEVPQGTAFETGDRLFSIGVGDENNDGWLRKLWERAPYSYRLAMHNAYLENGRSYTNLSGAIVEKWLGPQVVISLKAMQRLAACYEGQPDLYEAAMKKAAVLDPDIYLKLGAYFECRGMEEKAAEYYMQAFEKANNRVWMANCSLWLVKYLFQKNDRATAEKVAEDAAEVYSYGGLEAYQWLMEAEDRWDKALETAVKIDKRYNDDKPCCEIACLIRLNKLAPIKAAAAGFREKTSHTFPNGVQEVKLTDFSIPPKTGVLIKSSNQSMVPFGLEKGMVIVALDGYRTDTLNQYFVIRSLSDDPNLRLIVWDGSSYRVSEGKLPERRFGVDMGDYVSK